MYVKPCPKCGRTPKITECVRDKYDRRRRLIRCPNYCSVVEANDYYKHSWFLFVGDGDDNTIYKEWNNRLTE